MSKAILAVNRRKYFLAQEMIHNGAWVIDPLAGTVFSTKFQRLIKPNRQGKYGRCTVAVWIPETKRQLPAYLHRIVWENVHGPIPTGLEVNHIDGDPLNNGIGNLELVTCAENIQHAHRTGLHSLDVTPEVTAQVVADLDAGGVTFSQLMTRYGISMGSVARISSSRPNWRKREYADPSRTEKSCMDCGQTKPIGDFHVRRRGSRDGRVSYCKPCSAVRQRQTRSACSSNVDS